MDDADAYKRRVAAERAALDGGVASEYVEPFVDEFYEINYVLDDFLREDILTEVIDSPTLLRLKSHFSGPDAKQKLLSFIIENRLEIETEYDLFVAIKTYFERILSWGFEEG